jgi:hypothetical protein
MSLLTTAPEVRPRRALRVVAWTVVALALLVGLSWGVVTSAYAPLEAGSFGGPRSDSVRGLTDGVEQTRYVLVGPEDTEGVVMYSLRNNGPLPVEVHGVDGAFEDARWAPFFGHEGLVGAQVGEVRRFPVTVRANEEIALWVTVRKPPCEEGAITAFGQLPLRWSVLGRDLDYTLELENPITVCYPQEALQHLND